MGDLCYRNKQTDRIYTIGRKRCDLCKHFIIIERTLGSSNVMDICTEETGAE